MFENPIPRLTKTMHSVEQLNKLYFVIQCLGWVDHNLISVSSFFR